MIFESLKRGSKLALRDVLTMEYYLCNAFIRKDKTDCLEGIRALLIDKDKNPKWKHKSVAYVKDEEVQSLFNMRVGISMM